MKTTCILLVHGLTECFHDKKYAQRMAFRDQLARRGCTTYEFDYRGRGSDKQNELSFSLASATGDVDAMIAQTCTVENRPSVLLLGRGMAAYFILKSGEAKRRKCPCILWQPIFFPKRTMENRGHVVAFQGAYSRSDGHEYVELDGVRLGKAFFESLSDASPGDVWDGGQFDVMYTQGDHVTRKEWVEEYLSAVAAAQSGAVVRPHILDSAGAPQEHMHQSNIDPFVEKTLAILQ